MPNEPQIETLSYEKRSVFFWVLFIIFLVALPSLIFYTTGYRLSFENEETSIVSTGGMYITTDNLEVEVYIDGNKEDKPRLFRSAYYIQDVEEGMHRVVVQQPGLHTWVKELPVDPHIVIEASAFNMPTIPNLRPIAKYTTATGTAVYLSGENPALILAEATTTEPYLVSSAKATTTFELNEEFIFVESLFASSTKTLKSVFVKDTNKPFKFATTSLTKATTSKEETIKEVNGVSLVDHDNEVFALWSDFNKNIPHYFCISEHSTGTKARYGSQFYVEVERMIISTSTPIIYDNERLCRPEIKIDRQGQDVYFYDFMPNNSDLVLLQREDGVYVTEIDDRAWQNTQRIYSGDDSRVVIENNLIFIYDDGLYFELVTKIDEN